ncbi:MAG: hypothetical protein ACP5KW_11250 [Thermoproteota archaeon]
MKEKVEWMFYPIKKGKKLSRKVTRYLERKLTYLSDKLEDINISFNNTLHVRNHRVKVYIVETVNDRDKRVYDVLVGFPFRGRSEKDWFATQRELKEWTFSGIDIKWKERTGRVFFSLEVEPSKIR